MKTNINEIEINGAKYIKKGSEQVQSKSVDGMEYVIIRSVQAGVFAGYLKSKDRDEVTMVNTRRLWYWDGASSLSQLAMVGVTKPENCKFSVVVNNQIVLGVCEILNTTEKAKTCIEEIESWKK